MITRDMTIAQAIKENSAAVQVMVDKEIDYCCGGDKPLEIVAKEKNIDLDELVDLLNKQKGIEGGDLKKAMTLGKEDLINYIIQVHHVPELKMIEEIDLGMRRIINAHYAHHGKELEAIYKVFMDAKKDLIPHFAKEEKQDFPNFIENSYVDFDELRAEHEAVGSLLEKLDEMTNHFTVPEDGCATYHRTFELLAAFEADIHNHIFLENSVLFLM
ncbi:MAG TPA: DUF542 domain-containing protein [Candidatus Dorea intestinavium]|nr:DUF542 domain-containing protein [Candidatus Dorea intestinavium]